MKKCMKLLAVGAAAASLATSCGSQSSGGAYDEYLTLAEYKGIPVTRIKSEVTDEAVQEEIDYVIDDNAEYNEITDRGCQEGDLVNIDFTGTIDGEEFDGGSGEDYEIVLGEGYFLEDLEAEIVGMTTGETKEITITFPEDYDEELGGQEAFFSVTVNTIYEIVRPEYNDAFVSSISDFSTTEEYEEDLRQTLLEQADESNDYTAGYDALYSVIDASTFSGYPQELYDECEQEYDDMNAMYAEMFGMDVEDFEMSDEDTQAAIEEMVYEEMVVRTIAEREDLEPSDEDFNAYVDTLYEDYGYESAEDFLADYSEESIRDELLLTNVMNFLLENAEITEVSEDEYYGDIYEEEETDELMEEELIDETDGIIDLEDETGSLDPRDETDLIEEVPDDSTEELPAETETDAAGTEGNAADTETGAAEENLTEES